MKKQNGQTLIEVLLAASVTTLLLVALLSLVTKAIRNSQFSKNKSLASKYVEEGLEVARKSRDRSITWEDFYTNYPAGTYTLDSALNFNQASCTADTSANIGTIFTRCAVFADESEEIKQIQIIVYWKDGVGAHDSRGQIYLTKWR